MKLLLQAPMFRREARLFPLATSLAPMAWPTGTILRRTFMNYAGYGFVLAEVGRGLFSSTEAPHYKKQTYQDYHESQDSYHDPSEHTGIILIAVVENKLPKPQHIGLGHVLYKHRVRSVAPLLAASIAPQPVYLTASKDSWNNARL